MVPGSSSGKKWSGFEWHSGGLQLGPAGFLQLSPIPFLLGSEKIVADTGKYPSMWWIFPE